MPAAHAKLSPSAAKRWLNCPGSVALCSEVVDSGGRAADEGTAGHFIFEQGVKEGVDPYSFVGQTIDVKGSKVLITEEIAGWVDEALQWVFQYVKDHGTCIVLSEEEIDIGPVFGLPVTEDGKTNLWGTSDLGILAPDELVIADLKLGYQPVEAEGNLQLLLYAMGLLHAHQLFDFDTVRIVIIQPRSGGVKEWVVPVDFVLDEVARLQPKVLAAMQPDAPIIPGDDQCEWCKAAAMCPALREHALAAARREFQSIETLSVEELAEVLSKADLIRTTLKHYEAHAKKLLSLGQRVPGWKRVKSKKHRVWSNETSAVATMKTLGYDEDDFYPRSLVTPAQAEKMLGKTGKDILAAYITTPEGEATLAPESDPRPALPGDFEQESAA